MLSIRLAFRNLFRNVRRTVLTALLIGCSLAALIVSEGVTNGMLDLIVNAVTQTIGGEAQVHKTGYLDSLDADLYLTDVEAIEATLGESDAVESWALRLMAAGMVSSSYNVAGGVVYGIDANAERNVSLISTAVIEGTYLSGDPGEILMGEEMAELLELSLGDRVVITLSEVDGGELSQALFRLSGIARFGIREMDKAMVFINIDRARQVLALETGVHEIAIQFKGDAMTGIDASLLGRLQSDSVEALDWRQLNPEIGATVEMVGFTSLIVGSILFLLASLGVINSMFMSIYERIYEFGVIRAIGTTPAELFLLILCEAFLLALLAIIAGLIIGLSLNYYFATSGIPLGEIEVSGIAISDNVYSTFSISQYTTFPLVVMLLTLLATLYPAKFAAQIVPSEALHRSL